MTNENTVYVRSGRHKSGGTDTVYHTDPDCGFITDRHVEKPRDIVEVTEWRECDRCAGEWGVEGQDQAKALRYQV